MEMFLHEFMQRAFIAGTLIAILAPLFGLFVILRRQSLIADTLAHISLAGVAVGFTIGVNPTLTTIAVVVLGGLTIEIMRSFFKTYSELSIAILMSGGLAVALVLTSFNGGNSTASISQYLFGSIVTIDAESVFWLLGLAIVAVTLYLLFRRHMYVLTFDEDTAYTSGLNTRLISMVFSVLTGLAVAIMMPIVGALLVSSLMILPSAIAIKWVKSFDFAIILSIVMGLIGVYSGLTMSYQVGSPPGASITIVLIVMFIISMIVRTIWLRSKGRKYK
ncbi:metal ABC transporter permease [Brochothrix thermosphacta]|uniref:Metal ABC transporter permease n=1 Tax=Brochothrix thermosphacta TaxID=2756 RepID=A0A1D2L5J7_BROTH|nr:metal ABC transporter permease [Brochothrix thermosphacta]ATF26233.1 metal ABC transporter permease [Brochothrix thermosphacta]ATH85574.1 metal ABC transporter permease [Brochothrix thermosphacta]MPQ29714.1 metal ABC transporter permease [Brochothrix thermosphacta]ODJ65120.1 zinc ABC transporter permease [Brochothrix thermosphacta]ODJ72899.1 zinc ABC transporter permease [Brochothrix thermosphacta]